MNFPDGLFADDWLLAAWLLLIPGWLWSLRTAPWRQLADQRRLNAWLAAIVLLAWMWHLNAGVRPGLNLHLLGATLMTLMFGRQLAVVGLSAVLALVTFNGAANGAIGWSAYAINALAMILVPVTIAWAIFRSVDRWLPHNLFVYILVATFFGAALNTVLSGALATLLLTTAHIYPMAKLLDDFVLSYILLAFAEAWLTGAIITLLVVYCPHCVATFDDRRHLWNK